ncbi:protein kinase domain-containing protein [Chondromyces apiculatus]|uniref:WD-repeat protein n=1 Tax=Chondromyces apiculatus DSM 436 TaxID=1192034 RepID=A0A017T383_9BACT|nr:protein kinase [Chondromyces apiculatus]EYF03310.1 WD-repeat protein [Chondromyces apiculatus DSM 436]
MTRGQGGDPEREVVAPGERASAAKEAMFAETLRASPPTVTAVPPGALMKHGDDKGASRWTAAQLPEVDPARYVVSGQIAQGGIGRVLRAEDVQMQRPVALKELLERGGDAEDRFVREALLTARLQHPAIVPVYEAGRWPTGAPFLAMKLVSGRSLAEVINEPRGLDERLPLVIHVLAVAQAMAYAHAERIIHRDLKPANVLVGDFGETVVIDWGLAKELPPEGAVRASLVPGEESAAEEPATGGLTVAGAIVGTPAYMPPEQAAGLPVDERADVYAVGAMLYHLLSGAPPYEGTARQVLREVMVGRAPPLGARVRGVPEDLLAIVDKAMARRREDRYASARELSEDLERFHAGQLVGAHRYSRRELLVRFVRRHRGALSVAAAALLVLMAGGTYGVLRVMAARDQEADERRRAESARGQAEVARQAAVARADQLVLAQARTALPSDPNEALGWLNSLSPSFSGWDAARTLAADAEGRGIARVLRGHRKLVNTMVYAPGGEALYSASDDCTVRRWDLVGGKHREVAVHADEAWWVSLSPDGRRMATASKDREVRVVDLGTGATRALRGHTGSVNGAVFLPGERELVSFGGDGRVLRWDLKAGTYRALCEDKALCWKVVVSPERQRAAVTGMGGALAVLDLETGALQRAPAAVKVFSDILRLVGMMPVDAVDNARRVAAGGEDGRLWVWEPGTGEVRTFVDHEAPVHRVRFSPDGRTLASADAMGVVRLRDLESGATRVARGHEGAVNRLAWSHEGRWLASAGEDHTARLWDVETDQRRVLHGARDVLIALAFAPDGRSLATAGGDGVVRIYRVNAGSSEVIGQHEGAAFTLAVAPGGSRVATGGADGKVRVWPLGGGAPRVFEGHRDEVRRVVFSPDGKRLASSGDGGEVRVWDGEGRSQEALQALYTVESKVTDRELLAPAVVFSPDGARLAVSGGAPQILHLETGVSQRLEGVEGEVWSVAFSPDGRELGAAGGDRKVRIWEVATGGMRVLGEHENEAASVAFSPRGDWIASGGHDHALRLWERGGGGRGGGGGVRKVIQAGGQWVSALEFAPDGGLLVGLTGHSAVPVWDARAAVLRQELRGHGGVVKSVHLAGNGRGVISASTDGTVRVWDLATGQAQVLRGHAGAVFEARFLPEGRGFVSVGRDGTVRLWRDALPRDAAGLRAWIAEAVRAADPRMAGEMVP